MSRSVLGRIVIVLACVAAVLAPAGSGGAAAAVSGGARQASSCAALGSLSGHDVFVAGDMNVTNNQLQGAAAAGGNVTMSSYGVSVGLPADPARLDLVAGRDLTVSNARSNGSVRYGGTLTGSISVPSGGTVDRGQPPFSFEEEIGRMQLLSFAWGTAPATGTVTPSGEVLALAGTSTGLNVFTVTTTELQRARNITIGVPPGGSALINVSGSSYSTAVSGAYGAGNSAVPAIWNFTGATALQISGLNWYGSILAPNAAVTASNAQIYGHIWASGWEGTGTVLQAALPPCLPAPPEPVIKLEALCVNPVANELLMRLRNEDPEDRRVKWSDELSAQEGRIDAGAATDTYFAVEEGDQPHTIVAQSGTERAVAKGVTRACRGTINVHKTVSGSGKAPPGSGAWW